MPPAPYPDFRWFLRTLRVVPVVAVAALAGGIIGGFSVFAIDVALTAPPNHGVPPEPGSKLASETTEDSAAVSPARQSTHSQSPAAQASTPQSMRTFDAATPAARSANPAAATATPAPAAPAQAVFDSSAALTSSLPAVSEAAPVSANDVQSAQPTAAAMRTTPSGAIDGAIAVVHPQTDASNQEQTQPQHISWPDALSREQPRTRIQPATVPPETITADRPAEPETTAKTPRAGTSTAESSANSAPKPDAVRRHVAVKRATPLATERTGEASLARGRPIYDDYSRDNGRNAEDSARTKYRTAKPQYDTRRQPPPADVARSGDRGDGHLYDQSDRRDADDSQDALPPQPPPPQPLPFFGLFGGGDRD